MGTSADRPGSPAIPLLDFLFLLPPVRVPPKLFGRDSNTNNLITCFQLSGPIKVFILFTYFHFILLKEYATSIKEIYFQQSGEESKPDAEYSTPFRGHQRIQLRHQSTTLQLLSTRQSLLAINSNLPGVGSLNLSEGVGSSASTKHRYKSEI